MLKNITIFSDKIVYLNKDYAISFKNPDFLQRFLLDVDEEMVNRGYYDQERVIDLLSLNIICYKIKEPLPLFFALTFDDSIEPQKAFDRLQDLIDVTLNYIEETESINENKNPKLLETDCEELIRDFLMIRPPKISIIGDEGVGKTSICEMIKSGILPDEGDLMVNKYYSELFGIPVVLWDVRISRDWQSSSKHLLGSDAVIIVLDSTLKNARFSKPFLEMTEEVIPNSELLVVANKQDVEGALSPKELEDILGCKVFPFVANKPDSQLNIQIQAAKLLELLGPEIDYEQEDYIIHRD
jgi:signal recognition particle receptor subunit beta